MTNLGFYGQVFCGFCAQITANVVMAQQSRFCRRHDPVPIAVWLLCNCCIAFARVHCFRDGGVAPTIISRAMM